MTGMCRGRGGGAKTSGWWGSGTRGSYNAHSSLPAGKRPYNNIQLTIADPGIVFEVPRPTPGPNEVPDLNLAKNPGDGPRPQATRRPE